MTLSQPRIPAAGIALWCVLVCTPALPAEPAETVSPVVAATEPVLPATESAAAGSPSEVTLEDRVAPAFSSPRENAIASALGRLEVAGQVEAVQQNAESFLTFVTGPIVGPHRSQPPLGAVLLIPALGGAVSDALLLALAAAPTASGWLTMAMQSPGATPTTNDPGGELCARISASLKFLQAQHVTPVVLAGIGRSVDHSLACFSDKLPAEITALVGIGRWHGSLNGLELPVLDVLPAADRAAQRASGQRAVDAKQRARGSYRQISIDAANDLFEGGQEEVAKRLRGWLIQLPLRSKA